ncbi:MAG: hypothetical protein JJ866_19190 [Roseibium sp.]|uniref:hypothetical protein n=1 Tax=Roseibium sp. TaxID=1936156 RepID=UPI001B2BF443|nr:hypothetical protein [Roseibium sp.]MBO6894074.1 hypothetical protein [Roseibium sp.]MBO6929722.1 hypothetical protein [Roseibium sp.]
MRTTRKIVSSVIAATFVSAAAATSAFAFDPDDTVGDLNGDKPVSVRQQQIANAKALEDARGNRLLILPVQGSYNGEERFTARQQAASNAKIASRQGTLPILEFIGDWNGTSKPGFARQ